MKIPTEAKKFKFIFLISRQSGISSNKQKFKRIGRLLGMFYIEEIVRLFEMSVPLRGLSQKFVDTA